MKQRTEDILSISIVVMKMASYLCMLFVVGFAIYAAVSGFSSSKTALILIGTAAFVVLQILYRSFLKKFFPWYKKTRRSSHDAN